MKISVVIPVYNSEKYLKSCLDSVICQSHRDLEIILIDDGSTDKSGEICDDYAKSDDRMIVIHNENRGVSAARNIGISVSTGDCIHFLDSDDYLDDDAYEYMLGLMDKHGCDVVNCEHYVTYPANEKIHSSAKECYGLFTSREDMHRVIMSGKPFLWTNLFKRELICGDSSPRLREDIYRGEDTLFLNEILENARSVYFDKRPLYHYVQSDESACRGEFKTRQLSALKLIDAYRPLYEKYPALKTSTHSWMAHLHITLYADMYFYGHGLKSEMETVKKSYRDNYKEITGHNNSLAEWVKFSLFRVSPTAFCMIRKLIHNSH